MSEQEEAGEAKQQVVTIDGSSGVGKSTVSRRVAAALGFTYLDTGAMYRAVAHGCDRAGIDALDADQQDALAALLIGLDIRLLPPADAGDDVRVLLAGEDISTIIRTPEMGMAASRVSGVPAVRVRLTAMQQEMGRAGQLVAEGRDTGTVVFPNAAWKFFLDAAPEVRCQRRVDQLRANGQQVNEEEMLAQIIKRDQNDRQRTIAPLVRAEDALLVDSSEMTADEVVGRMLAVIRQGD